MNNLVWNGRQENKNQWNEAGSAERNEWEKGGMGWDPIEKKEVKIPEIEIFDDG